MDTVLQSAVDAFHAFVANDERQLQRVSERRHLWENTTRATIENGLNELTSAAKNGRRLVVSHGQRFENFELMQINFGKIPTGVRLREGSRVSNGFEIGAALVFGQGECGRVSVVRYPFCTELPNQRPSHAGTHDFVGSFEPEYITRAFVLDQAREFIVWASRTPHWSSEMQEERRVGFVPPRLTKHDGEG